MEGEGDGDIVGCLGKREGDMMGLLLGCLITRKEDEQGIVAAAEGEGKGK